MIMGLFDRFSGGRAKKTKQTPSESLRDYTGLRVEVLDQDDQLLFLAVLIVLGGGKVDLRLPEGQPKVPEEIGAEPFEAHIRGYEERLQQAVHMEGTVTRISEYSWNVEYLRIVGKDNDRAFFRQNINTVGEVSPVDDPEDVRVCTVHNVSAGGVCLRVDAEYPKDTRLKLRTRLTSTQAMSSIMCEVRRVTLRRDGKFEYGCRFLNLSPVDEDRISKAIMEMQQSQARRQLGR